MSDEPLDEREADQADSAEQRRTVGEDGDADEPLESPPVEADPADAVDQRRAVPVDDDDYR